MLTRKQHELLMFIHQRIRETGISPSFDEMKDALDLRSKSGIHRLISALEERGFIKRLAHKARALEVVRLPDTAAPAQPRQGQGFKPEVIKGDMDRRPKLPDGPAIEAASVEVPVMGRIAAGVPIEAIQQHSHHVGVPTSMMSSGEHYALEVKGDSMIDAGILEGDTVIIKRCTDATNGDIVVALVENEEATLKRLRKRGTTIALEAANPKYETRIYGPDQVQIQGKLVGLMRHY